MTHPIFEKYNSLTPWGRFKRLIRGIVGIPFIIMMIGCTVLFLVVELGNYTLDIIVDGEK